MSKKLLYPLSLIKAYPINKGDVSFITQSRKTLSDIIAGKDKRLLVIVGPSAIYDVEAARQYAQRLMTLRNELADKLFIVMRVYIDKPDNRHHWQGLINDPYRDQSFQFEQGLDLARHLLLDLTKWRLPLAVEYLDLLTPQYFADLVTWVAINGGNTESQTHRQLASGLSSPIGFSSSANGHISAARDAIVSASHRHMFLGIDKKGRVARFQTAGNPNCHLIIKGDKTDNNYQQTINNALSELNGAALPTRLMIDLSEGSEQFDAQPDKNKHIINCLKQTPEAVCGVMIASNLLSGKHSLNQHSKLVYGQRITDARTGWQQSEHLLRQLADAC